MLAISANSIGANSTRSSTTSSTTSNKASKVGKLQQRAIDGYAKKLALMEKYKELLRLLKITERYYEHGEKDKMPLRRNKITKYLGSAKIYNKLPTINANMTNEEIQKTINDQRKKMIQGVLRGEFPEFKEKTIQLARLKKEQKGKLSNKDKEPLKNMRNNLLNKHKKAPLKTIINAESLMKEYIQKTIGPLKRTFEEFEKTTQVYILKKQKMNEERVEKKKKQVELQKYKKLVKLFKARQKKIVKAREANVKARKKSAEETVRKEAKKGEKAARQEAKEADTERKKVVRNEKAVEKARKESEKTAKQLERQQKADNKRVEREVKEAEKLQKQQQAAQKRAEREARQAIKQAARLLAAIQKGVVKKSAKY
jgi:hypothetical protein